MRLLTLGKEDLLLGRLLLSGFLHFEHLRLPFKEPLVVAGHLGLGRVKRRVAEVGAVLTNVELLGVHDLVLPMHLPHLLDLVQVDNEAALVCMVFFDALAAKDRQMIRTVEVLDALIMFFAEQAIDAFFVFEVDVA